MSPLKTHLRRWVLGGISEDLRLIESFFAGFNIASNFHEWITISLSVANWMWIESSLKVSCLEKHVQSLLARIEHDIVDFLDSNSVCKLFADDVKFYSNFEFSSTINSDINPLVSTRSSLQKWSCVWQMRVNISKCSVLHLGLHNPLSQYAFNGFTFSNFKFCKRPGYNIQPQTSIRCLYSENCFKSPSNG